MPCLLSSSDITPLIPPLINLLTPPSSGTDFDDDEFTVASDVLQEIMSKSAMAGGTGSKTLTEPLLLWCERYGTVIVDRTLNGKQTEVFPWITRADCGAEGFADTVSRSFCKLLTALGDHSTTYFASNIASTASPSPVLPELITAPLPSKSRLVQTFLRLLMAYTGIPGYYGADEEESEMTLGFWYLFQETLWSTGPDYDDESEEDPSSRLNGEQWSVSRAVYSELIQVLRRKSVWPPKSVLQGWPRGALVRLMSLPHGLTFSYLRPER